MLQTMERTSTLGPHSGHPCPKRPVCSDPLPEGDMAKTQTQRLNASKKTNVDVEYNGKTSLSKRCTGGLSVKLPTRTAICTHKPGRLIASPLPSLEIYPPTSWAFGSLWPIIACSTESLQSSAQVSSPFRSQSKAMLSVVAMSGRSVRLG